METSLLQPGVEIHPLHSRILDQDLLLFIKLPLSYARSDKTYPVLFCTDANRSFPLYSTMSLIYETPGTGASEILIAGIGYQLDADRMKALCQWAAWRTRDLTPARSIDDEQYWKIRLTALLGSELEVQSGGARRFLQALREEIIPFVEANFRASAADRGLAGHSYGGLFTLYALFQAPGLFTRCFAGSPSLWDESFADETAYAATHTDLKARLLITTGGRESDLVEPVQRMVERLRSRGFPGLELSTQVFEDEDHSSAYAAAVSRALRVLYGER